MRARLLPLLTTVPLVLLAVSATAQEAPAPPGSAELDQWVGTWNAEGNMMGMAVSGTVTWQWTLGDWYLHGHQALTMTTPDGDMSVEAAGILKPNGDGTYTGHWYESTGMDWEMTGTTVDGNVVLAWSNPMGTFQMTIATVVAGETGTSTMQQQAEDGSWAEAGAMTYTAAASE